MTVYLLGDSIRMNAESHIRSALEGVSISSPSQNCESSREILANLQRWAPAASGDVIHVNCGLHDIRYNPGASQPVCSLPQYESNLIKVFQWLADCGATVIWATSTPINEQLHNTVKPSHRYLADLVRYNALSVDLARKFGFAVNDLYGQLAGAGLDELLLPDGIHFSPAGNAVVGAAVVRALSVYLPSAKPCN